MHTQLGGALNTSNGTTSHITTVGLAGFTPEQVFTDRYKDIATAKQQALDDRYSLTPERFTNGKPLVAMPEEKVMINPITPEELADGVSNVVNFPTLDRVKEKYTLTLN